MKKQRLTQLINCVVSAGLLMSAGLCVTSCSSDDDNPASTSDTSDSKETPNATYNYLLETCVANPDGMSGSTYIQKLATMPTSINNKNGTQLSFCSYLQAEVIKGQKYLFAFPAYFAESDSYLRRYTYDEQTQMVSTPKKLELTPQNFSAALTVVSDTKMYVPECGPGKITVVNPQTMEKTGSIDLTSYAYKDNSPEPSCGIVRDGYYYQSLNQVGATMMPYEDYRQCDVAIINTNTDKVEKVISEKTTHMTYASRPILPSMVFSTESKDIYFACCGYFGMNSDHPETGFICIPAGKQDFDSSKAWDIHDVAIEGSEYKAASLWNCEYVGDGIVVAFVAVRELMDSEAYTARYLMAVRIDLNKKKIYRIQGIPYSSATVSFIDQIDNLTYMGIYSTSDSGFYSYNPTTNDAEKVISTVGYPFYMHVF